MTDKTKLERAIALCEDHHNRFGVGGECEPFRSAFREVLDAATLLREIMPDIKVMVEARRECRDFACHTKPDTTKHEAVEAGTFLCPLCEGSGEVEGEQHINVRGLDETIVMNVLFTGIDGDHKKWQRFVDSAANAVARIAQKVGE